VREHVATFAAPCNGRAACIVGLTLALWLGTLSLNSWWFKQSQALSTWWGLLLSGLWLVARLGAFVRTSGLVHDGNHYALFNRRWANEWVAFLAGVLTGTDAADYRRSHAQHHAVLGIEEETQRDPDLIVLWTTKEWADWPRGLSKAAARVMVDPLVLYIIIGPFTVLLGNFSWPQKVTHMSGRARVLYTLCKLLVLACVYPVMFWLFNMSRTGIWAELLAQQCALSYAMFLFVVQHTFEGVYRVPRAEHNRTVSALSGSSFLSMPWWWSWATLGIEYHHIHHINTRVPCYRLKACQDALPASVWEAAGVRKVGARDGFRAMIMSLWDADTRCYVPFPEWAWLDRLLKQQPASETVHHGKKE